MAKQKYKDFRFTTERLNLIVFINSLIHSYQAQGLKLTIRQLYYQLVARDVIPNNIQSYKRIVDLMTNARLDGLIDWDAIEDRTREVSVRSHWTSGASILDACATSFYMDRWANQDHRVFVVVEKEALFGVLEGVCQQNDVPLMAARGYPSVTILHQLAEDFFLPAIRKGQQIHMLHLGDHDPSGVQMTEDLQKRLEMFLEDDAYDFALDRIALTMDQIQLYNPPPNPAKQTDSRFTEYAKLYGSDSWELDALEPTVLIKLVAENIERFKDEDAWRETGEEIESVRSRLREVADEFRKAD